MKDELIYSYKGGGVVYQLQSVAIHFNLTVNTKSKKIEKRIYTQKARHFAKIKIICVKFHIKKARHFMLRNFS